MSSNMVGIVPLPDRCAVPSPFSMRYPTADTVNRRIAENKRLTQKARLAALAAIRVLSMSMLVRLLRNPDTPSRLKTLAAQLYEKEILRREVDRVLSAEVNDDQT
jgi:hypothetical protein